MLKFLDNVKVEDLSKDLRNRLTNFEFYLKGDVIITSGLRTPEHNKKVGGSPTSSHLKGLACDIACNSSKNAFIIIKTALDAGFKRIGIAKDHIHLDVDEEKTQYCMWLE